MGEVDKVEYSEDVPHDRMTRLCDAMTQCLEEHPEYEEERCVIFVTGDGGGGLVGHGYEESAELMEDICQHLRAFGQATGIHSMVIPMGRVKK